MKYFLHDTSAFQDEKITLLYMKFGFEGVGLFFSILEKIAMQEKPVREEVLKTQLYIKNRLQKQLDFMYEIGILSIKNGDVFNENLLSFSQKYQIKKEKTRKRVEEWRAKQEDVTHYKRVSNARKVKESKVKEDIYQSEKIAFDLFWNAYDKKVGDRTRIEKKWNNLSLETQQSILAYLPKYKKAQPDKQFRKNPETFLNQKSWNDELIGYEMDEKDKIREENAKILRMYGVE